MTKREAQEEFCETVLPGIREQFEKDGKVDQTARVEGWKDFTDGLVEAGRLSRATEESWTCPY